MSEINLSYLILSYLILSNDTKQFIVTFKQRCKNIYTQTCFSEIEKSNRCRLYRDIKEVHDTEFYFRQQYNCHLWQGLSKIRLSSHKFFVERGRWSKPKVEYIDRLCTLCDQRDIKDEYHNNMSTLFRPKSEFHQETVLCSTKHA